MKPAIILSQIKKLAKKTSGFTLLELLIVIAIIGILVSLGTVAYSTAQKKARDTRRMGDMKSIQNAQEQYYADNSSGYAPNQDALKPYIAGVFPIDPDPTKNYVHTTSASTYCACAALEGTLTGGNSTVNDCSNFQAGSYFCVKSLQ